MSWERVLKTPPPSTPPFKGSRHREKYGYMDKLNTFQDTNLFLSILDEIYMFDKKDIFYFLEKPYKWQNEYEIFKKAMDLLEDVKIGEEPLHSGNFAEWFSENYGQEGWNKLSGELKELEQAKDRKE